MSQRRSDHALTRRQLLKKTGLLLGVVVSADLKNAVLNAAGTGLPLLTDATLTAMFAQNGGLLSEFAANPIAFMLGHFSLTPAQTAAVKATTPAEIAAIRQGVQAASQDDMSVRVSCITYQLTPQQTTVAQAGRFQYVKDAMVVQPGRRGTLYMNVSGFQFEQVQPVLRTPPAVPR
jgi:hypothetical protein